MAFPGRRVVFWQWESYSHWVVSPTPKGSPSFSSLAEFLPWDCLCKLYMLFSFSSLIEFPTLSSPVPSFEQILETDSHSQQSMPQVFAIAAYSKGFACSAGPGRVLLFEKMEDKDFYHESREIRVRREGISKTGVLLTSVLQQQSMDKESDGEKGCSTEQQGGFEQFVLRKF